MSRAARVMSWLPGPIESTLQCQNGHAVRDRGLIVSPQVVRCQACSRLLYVIPTAIGAGMAISITIEDVRIIKTHATFYETLRYFGLITQEAA